MINIWVGDCMERMRGVDAGSISTVVCDPPYGVEFFGDEKKDIGLRRTTRDGFNVISGQSKLPSYSATSMLTMPNRVCLQCGKPERGSRKCQCDRPHEHWKQVQRKGGPPLESVYDAFTWGGMLAHLAAMERWHKLWLTEVERVLVPGGRVKVFSSSRLYHRLAAAMDASGLQVIGMEAWGYSSGFPKAVYVDKAVDRELGVERPVLRTVKRGRDNYDITGPGSDEAALWVGWTTALKPAWEVVIVGVKE